MKMMKLTAMGQEELGGRLNKIRTTKVIIILKKKP
jgi:hypothetical protein